MVCQIGVQEVRLICPDKGRRPARRTRGELAGAFTETGWRHAPIADVEGIADLLIGDGQRNHALVQPEAERIEARKKETDGVGCSLHIDIVCSIAHEEDRVVDQDKVLRRRGTFRHAHEFDRHAPTVTDVVGAGNPRTVREAYPGLVSARLREQATRRAAGKSSFTLNSARTQPCAFGWASRCAGPALAASRTLSSISRTMVSMAPASSGGTTSPTTGTSISWIASGLVTASASTSFRA